MAVIPYYWVVNGWIANSIVRCVKCWRFTRVSFPKKNYSLLHQPFLKNVLTSLIFVLFCIEQSYLIALFSHLLILYIFSNVINIEYAYVKTSRFCNVFVLFTLVTFFLFLMWLASRVSCALPGARAPHSFIAMWAYANVITNNGITYYKKVNKTWFTKIDENLINFGLQCCFQLPLIYFWFPVCD